MKPFADAEPDFIRLLEYLAYGLLCAEGMAPGGWHALEHFMQRLRLLKPMRLSKISFSHQNLAWYFDRRPGWEDQVMPMRPGENLLPRDISAILLPVPYKRGNISVENMGRATAEIAIQVELRVHPGARGKSKQESLPSASGTQQTTDHQLIHQNDLLQPMRDLQPIDQYIANQPDVHDSSHQSLTLAPIENAPQGICQGSVYQAPSGGSPFMLAPFLYPPESDMPNRY